MTMKDFLRATSHLALYNQPLTLSEVRELTIRHLLSTVDDRNAQLNTRLLFEMYLNKMAEEIKDLNGDTNMDRLLNYMSNQFFSVNQSRPDPSLISGFFRKNYSMGFRYGMEESGKPFDLDNAEIERLPENLPLSLSVYPRDIIEQYAAVLGYMTATGRKAA